MDENKKEKRILIAEDSPEWQNVHLSLLREYSTIPLNVEITSSAKEALSFIQDNLKTPYDLILTDLQMETDFHPKFAGEWLIQEIKSFEEYKNIPIVIISAAYNINMIAAKLGTDCLSKRTLVSNTNAYNFMLDEHLL